MLNVLIGQREFIAGVNKNLENVDNHSCAKEPDTVKHRRGGTATRLVQEPGGLVAVAAHVDLHGAVRDALLLEEHPHLLTVGAPPRGVAVQRDADVRLRSPKEPEGGVDVAPSHIRLG